MTQLHRAPTAASKLGMARESGLPVTLLRRDELPPAEEMLALEPWLLDTDMDMDMDMD